MLIGGTHGTMLIYKAFFCTKCTTGLEQMELLLIYIAFFFQDLALKCARLDPFRGLLTIRPLGSKKLHIQIRYLRVFHSQNRRWNKGGIYVMLTIFEVILGSLAFVYTGSVVAWYARLEKLVRF